MPGIHNSTSLCSSSALQHWLILSCHGEGLSKGNQNIYIPSIYIYTRIACNLQPNSHFPAFMVQIMLGKNPFANIYIYIDKAGQKGPKGEGN